MASQITLKLSNKEVRRLKEIAHDLGYDNEGEMIVTVIKMLSTASCTVDEETGELSFYQTMFNNA
ncbi:hypothetical protein VBQ44_15205 [Klebsiella pneumoniae]|jgi:hypothetical protein|uniref:hypothetical protein n=1 Tax=Klebsiella pneumoniae TaxID=573 RepID=UPI00058DE3B6|nr:hypothetical protein [Klebsiella pneumoniae]EIX9247746.1 hypothetical protein [Klebsiella pneumoniae]EIX9512837.1 hypothetical protein [Klebsiella pneumoniae]KAB0284311.1 hypothetical protein FPQ51_00895 [Klebsiella pneumoniae]MBC4194911.1 hypothetical protein [Klebsiella pneumoniae]MBK2688414.1 hypothetical protein [Klebsiella pneumoniae]